jgi:RNA polymerase subunit RPABC4/transcription elongation factor Spt4
LIYLILRPAHTLEDEYQQTLEEEALLQAIEESPLCPGCGRRIKDSWSVCPNCHTKLRKNCHNCGKLMELPWNICPHCGTPAPGMRREHLTLDEALRPLGGDVEDEEIFEPVAFDDEQYVPGTEMEGDLDQEFEQFEEVTTSEETEEENQGG